MPEHPHSSGLLRRVATRLWLVSIGRRLYYGLCFLSVAYLAALLGSRLLGVVPDWFDPRTLLLIPAGAIALGLLLHRRPTVTDAARTVDRYGQTKDLYLTLALLEDSPGAYKPLVVRDAEQRAQGIRPIEVVPVWPGRRIADIALILAVLLGGIFYLPQLDPFGKVEAAQQQVKQEQELEKAGKASRLRAGQLKKDTADGELSQDVQKAVEELKSSLKSMKRGQKQPNAKALARNQKELGQKWRRINAQKLMDVLARSNVSQRFGRAASQGKLDKWTKQLQQGDTDGFNKEVEELKADFEKLMAAKDPARKAELMQRLKRKLKDLEEFASDRAGSRPLQAALKRAMKQLEMSRFKGMHNEALKAAQESLNLAKMELKEIAQSAKDLQELEKALQVAQLAKRINEQGELDGEACESCATLDDYADVFAEMGGLELTDEAADGTGGRAQGGGGMVDEDDSVQTDFKTEISKSSVQAGKVLLSLKTKGLSDSGDAKKDYRSLVRNVKQGMSEAILKERIPPGYHEGIKNYFDHIDDTLDNADAAQP